MRWRNLAGTAFAVLIMAIVLFRYGGDLRSIDFAKPALAPRLGAAVVIYTFVVFIGAIAWGILLKAFGAAPERWVAEKQLLVSQIGKYVPGNVAQYVGRAAMAVAAGIPARVVGLAIVTETAAIVLGGLLSVVIAIGLAPDQGSLLVGLLPEMSSLTWIGVAVAMVAVLLIALSLVSRRWSRLTTVPTVRWTGLAFALLLYIVALLLLGVSLHLIVGIFSVAPLPTTVAVFAAAWIAGLATPGAPGGLGVRESVIALGLAPLMGGAPALSAALLHRGASVIGDVISLGLGLALPKQHQAQVSLDRNA